MPGMPWVKLYTEILDDVKVLRLSDAQKWRFIQLILFAGECDAEGFLVKGDLPMTIEDVAWRLRTNETELKKDFQVLSENKLIEFDNEEAVWFILNFSDRQGRSQAGKRKQWRERQRSYRDKIRTQVFERSNGLCEYCDGGITYDSFIVEHILPPFRGGSVKGLENLAASCRSCNTIKGDRAPEEIGFKNPRVKDNKNVTEDKSNVMGDKNNVMPLEKRREESEGEKKKEEEEKEEEVDLVGVVSTLFEQEIGGLTLMIGEQIKDWVDNYPLPWIEDSIRIASGNNKRRVDYINGILKKKKIEGHGDNEQREGKDDGIDHEKQRDEDAKKARERLEKGRKEKES